MKKKTCQMRMGRREYNKVTHYVPKKIMQEKESDFPENGIGRYSIEKW